MKSEEQMSKTSVFSFSSNEIGKNSEIIAGILHKAKDGQQTAFTEIYELYFKKIYRFIFYRVSHKEVAEDLAEEVFLKAFSKIASVNKAEAFEGWLYQIARNLVIDYYRQKRSTVPLEEIENTLEYETNVVEIFDLSQEQKTLLTLIKELSAEQQVIIKLKFFEELDNVAISELLNKSEGNIRIIQHRAILKLRELMGQDNNE